MKMLRLLWSAMVDSRAKASRWLYNTHKSRGLTRLDEVSFMTLEYGDTELYSPGMQDTDFRRTTNRQHRQHKDHSSHCS